MKQNNDPESIIQHQIFIHVDPAIEDIQYDDLFLEHNKFTNIINIANKLIYTHKCDTEKLKDFSQIAKIFESDEEQESSYIDLMKSVIKVIENAKTFDVELLANILVKHLEEQLYENDRELELIEKFCHVTGEMLEIKVSETVRRKIRLIHNKIVKQVDEQYSKTPYYTKMEEEKIQLVKEIEKRKEKEEAQKLLLAVKLHNLPLETKKKVIREYKTKRKERNLQFEHDKKLGEIVGKPKRSIDEYEVVLRDMLTPEQASLFNFAELNVYCAHLETAKADVNKLFDYAKMYYPSMPLRGLEELSKIDYTQINYLLSDNILRAFKKKFINFAKFKELPDYIKQAAIGMPMTSQVEAVLKYELDPKKVLEAWFFSNYDSSQKTLDLIRKVYDKVDGDSKFKMSKAQETFEKIIPLDLFSLKCDSQLYAIIIYNLDNVKVKNSACFVDDNFGLCAIELLNERFNETQGTIAEKQAATNDAFNILCDIKDKNQMRVAVRYGIDKEALKNAKCFNIQFQELTLEILKKFFTNCPGDRSQKIVYCKEIFNQISPIFNKFILHVIEKHGLMASALLNTTCFDYTKEYSTKVLSILDEKPSNQEREDFFKKIEGFSKAQLYCLLKFDFPPDRIKNAKFFNTECEKTVLRIFATISPVKKDQLNMTFDLVENCDSSDKLVAATNKPS